MYVCNVIVHMHVLFGAKKNVYYWSIIDILIMDP